MADKKISQLTGATAPLAGTEVLPVVQDGVTKKVSIANLTAGREVGASSLNVLNPATTSTTVAKFGGTNNGTGNITYVEIGTEYADGSSRIGSKNVSGNISKLIFETMRVASGSFTEDFNCSSGNITIPSGNLIIGTSGKGITDSTNATALNFTSTGVGVNTTAPIVASQTAGAFAVGRYNNEPTLGVISDNRYLGVNSPADLFKITLSDDYGVTLIDIEIAGRGSNGTPFYFAGKRYITVNGGTSITVGTIGTDITSGNLTVDFTWVSGNSFKCTVTNTQTGVNAFLSTSLYVTAGGGGDNTAGCITELSYL